MRSARPLQQIRTKRPAAGRLGTRAAGRGRLRQPLGVPRQGCSDRGAPLGLAAVLLSVLGHLGGLATLVAAAGAGCELPRHNLPAAVPSLPNSPAAAIPAGGGIVAARASRKFPSGLAAPVRGERWRPGYGLVELRPDAQPDEAGETPMATVVVPPPREPAAAGATPTQRLGGERVQSVRQITPGPGTEADAGPIILFALPDATDEAATRRALARIATDPQVRRVEPDRLRRPTAVPNDPLWPQQWSLPLIRLPQAWEITQGAADVVVAFLDTGIVHGHPDLEGRLAAGYDFISTPPSADDGDPTRDADPTDTGTIDTSRLHGMHVAGTIGALTNNGVGIAGVDQKCRLMPVRVLGVNGGDGIDSDIADAVRWASGAQVGGLPRAAQPAQVLNMSFGGPGISFTLQRVIDEVMSRGLIVIAAAGNGGADAATYSPAGLDGVVAVGAVGPDGKRASYSNYGLRVDLLAPGGGAPEFGDLPDLQPQDLAEGAADGILSTYRDEGIAEPRQPPFTYGVLAGTSQAAPHVSGAAALVKSILPAVGPRTLAKLLRESANPSYRCPNDAAGGCGAGLLDIESLLRLAGQQKLCGCSGDLYCAAGICTAPEEAHPSIFDRPVIHGGWCAMGSSASAVGSVPCFGIAALVALSLFRRRRSRAEWERPA